MSINNLMLLTKLFNFFFWFQRFANDQRVKTKQQNEFDQELSIIIIIDDDNRFKTNRNCFATYARPVFN